MRDLFSHIKTIRALSPVATPADNTAQVSQIIDRRGFDSLVFAILLGALPDADATFAVLIEDGDAANLSDAVAVADAELNGTEAGAGFIFSDDNAVTKIGYTGNKRYVRLTITPSANASASLLAAVAILGHPERAPLSTQKV